MDKRVGRCLAAARQSFQSAAFILAECNSITGCHAPIIYQETSYVNMRNILYYMVLAEMAAYSAITGFSEDEAPLLFGKLSGIIQPFDPTSKENQFSRVVAIAELGEPESSSTIDIERLLEIRNSAECMEFKRWLDDADSLTDEDIKTLLVGIRSLA